MRFRPLDRALLGVLCLFFLCAPALMIPGGALGKASYSYETDPIRLGFKAIEEGRLDDAKKNFDEAVTNEYQVHRAQYGLAEVLRRQGNYTEAEATYREAMATLVKDKGTQDFPECNAGLGLDLLRLGRTEEAKGEFQKALNVKSGLWEAQYGMARVSMEAGDFDGAIKLLSKGSSKKGTGDGGDLYHFGMGMALLSKGDLDAAEKEALIALQMNPGDPEYGTLVAQIYTKKGALPLAIDAQEKALAQPGARPTAQVLHNLGQLYQQQMYQMYKEGNKAEQQRLAPEAMRKYTEAVQLDSTYAPAWKDMGALYALANENDKAAGAYLRYAQLRSDDPEGLVGLAEACMKAKSKRYKQALEASEKAYALDSTKVETRLVLARALFVNKEKDRAAKIYSMVTDTLKFNSDDYIHMGQLKQDSGDLAGAEKDLRKALKWDSTNAEGWYSLGLVELKKDNNEGALDDFHKAARLDPENPTVRLNMGITYMRMRRNTEATGALREAVRLAPTAVQARVFYAQALLLSDSLGAAVNQYQKARELDPKNAGVLRGLGLGYLLRKDYNQAVSVLTEATSQDEQNADGWAWLGQAYASKGDLPKATESAQKALKINPNHAKAKELLDVIKKSTPPAGK